MTNESGSSSGDGSGDATIASDAERYCPSCDGSFPIAVERCPTDGTALVAIGEELDSLIGLEIDGRFTVRRRLGKGGMGAAYAALQHSIGREVAIKIIHPHLARDKLGAKRFLRETKLAAQLSHPNTVTVIDFGQTDSGGPGGRRLYMAMELVEGETLASLIRRQGALPIERAIGIGEQICDALGAAHRLKIVHRDLKPSNVMLESGRGEGDHVKVLDFGLAKSLAGDDTTVTESNVIVGTPQYISPELVVGSKADTRSDLYSLGAVLYELVAGRPPFVADSVQACLFSQVHDAPPPLPDSVPPAVADVILRLLAKRPELRFQTAEEARDALTGKASGRARVVRSTAALAATIDPSASIKYTPPPASNSQIRVFAVGGVALALTIAVVVFFATRASSPDSSAPGAPAAINPTQDASAVAMTPADATLPIDAPAPASKVTVRFETSPRGVTVSAPGGASCKSPCQLAFDAGSEPIALTLSRRGYRKKTIDMTPSRDDTVKVKLERRKKKATPSEPGDGFVSPYE